MTCAKSVISMGHPAQRHIDLLGEGDPARQAELDGWKQAPEAFVLLTMRPERIREGR